MAQRNLLAVDGDDNSGYFRSEKEVHSPAMRSVMHDSEPTHEHDRGSSDAVSFAV